jgi:hypothetical protein
MSVNDSQNPLDHLISFPADVVYLRADTRPDESHGWGLHLVLDLPRSIVQTSLATQLAMAGFTEETAVRQPGLLRFIRDDAYVWGMVSDGPERRTAVFVSITLAQPQEEEMPPPDWQTN